MRILLRVFLICVEVVAICAACVFVRSRVVRRAPPGEIRIDGSKSPPPQLNFASELETPQLQSLLADREVIDTLQRIGGAIALSTADLSPERAAVVQGLNRAGIPVTAWIALPSEEGYYLNGSNAPQAEARYGEFEKWSAGNGLKWAAVGLDIEPSLQDFGAAFGGQWLRVASTLLRRCFDFGRVERSRNAYRALIQRIQHDGYFVETCQFPFIADGRAAHSTVLERLGGIVDVRGDREVFMTYSSFNHPIDSALVWAYGPEAQAVAVGVTSGDPAAGGKFGSLSWDEFVRDTMVAKQISPVVGVYNLESCVKRGFLARLKTVDWGQTVTISADSTARVTELRARVQAVLWTASHFLYLVGVVVVFNVWMVWRRRRAIIRL